ncbi:MAG TPA: endonuclease/exonuclease/phosphatase family protein, partial [Anseongella sp.]|nr:endonuclease/exonuclease/phosphatase family protein [Anseongella sp.]
MKPVFLLFFFPLLAGFSFPGSHCLNAQTLDVMSYNIHHGANKEEVLTLEEMGRFIRESGADLVGLQEVDSICGRSGNADQMKVLAALTGMHYAFVRHFSYDGGAYGLGILSRYPVSDVRNDRITSLPKDGEKRSLALLSVKVSLPRGKAVRFATVHYALDQPTRLIQAAETLSYLKEDIPVILTGDLNAEPGTREIVRLQAFF